MLIAVYHMLAFVSDDPTSSPTEALTCGGKEARVIHYLAIDF